MIEVRDVALAYGGRVFVSGITFSLRAGEVMALVGPNGVGKTTLLRAMAGLHAPAAGEITLDGRSLGELTPGVRAREIALVTADAPIVDGVSVREVVASGRLPYRPWWRWAALPDDDAAVREALARTELAELAERPYQALSSGERQRVWLALALAQRARTLLLDEPTSHLDVRHAFEALRLLRALAAEGRAAVVVLHDLNLAAAFADRIALLGAGRLLRCAGPEEALDEGLLRRAYGVRIDVQRRADGRVLAFANPEA
ncbi:MAG TPA: ABC transporter ATP-binding protein [Candidatus Dormibacteraeota bacterium]|nr:ABC transporter ATP-binding protein [Candidatus Dormibacteraeota bacterium]